MDQLEQKIWEIRALARQDEKYLELLRTFRLAEKRLEKAEVTMSIPQRDILWDFFDLSEELNLRLLEIACEQALYGIRNEKTCREKLPGR